jgi:hypothetical protein
MNNSYCDVNNAFTNKGILHDNFNINTNNKDSHNINSHNINSHNINSHNINSNDLEKLARQINNNKKAKTKDIYQKYRTNPNNSSHAFSNMIISQADKGTKILPYYLNGSMGAADFAANIPSKDTRQGPKQPMSGFFSAQGEYAEFQNKDSDDVSKAKDISMGSDGIILDTPSDNSSFNSSNSSDSLSSLSWNTKKIDKHIKTKSKFNTKKRSKRHKCMDFDLDSVDSLESLDSGESLLRHIRICTICKEKVINLIKKHNFDKNENNRKKCDHIIDSINMISDDKEIKVIKEMKDDKDNKDVKDYKEDKEIKENIIENIKNNTYFKIPELKEIITVCLIGFLIIIILDLMMRSK